VDFLWARCRMPYRKVRAYAMKIRRGKMTALWPIEASNTLIYKANSLFDQERGSLWNYGETSPLAAICHCPIIGSDRIIIIPQFRNRFRVWNLAPVWKYASWFLSNTSGKNFFERSVVINNSKQSFWPVGCKLIRGFFFPLFLKRQLIISRLAIHQTI